MQAAALEPEPIQETPKHFGQPGCLTGVQAGTKSGQSRRLFKQRLAIVDRLQETLIPAVEKLIHGPKHSPEQSQALRILESHLARIDGFLSKAKKASDFRDLAQARSKLFEQWAHLAGIPKPMDNHGKAPRRSQTIILPTPDPEPSPPPAQLPAQSESR